MPAAAAPDTRPQAWTDKDAAPALAPTNARLFGRGATAIALVFLYFPHNRLEMDLKHLARLVISWLSSHLRNTASGRLKRLPGNATP
jgi:hypothetical protein